jgi:hypothetical protein
MLALFAKIEGAAKTETQYECAKDLKERLTEDSQSQACLRCSKAGFVIAWNNSGELKNHGWILNQAHCGNFYSLPRRDDSAAIEMPREYFCADETNETQVGAEPVLFGAADSREVVRLDSDREQQVQRPRQR